VKPSAAPMRPADAGAESVRSALIHAFAPMHKLAFGVAVGTALGLLITVTTVVHVALRPEPAPNVSLLGQYYYGYSVSLHGAVVGGIWGFASGFVAGWFAAFTRNLVIAVWIFVTRTRAELAATREFLDHI